MILSILILLSNLIVLAYLLVVPSSTSEDDIVILAIVATVANNILGLVATFIVVVRHCLGVTFSLRYFSIVSARFVISLGGALFYLQIMLALVF
ncbi:hypothetical protein [Adlercreutzia sp. ZJ304]|uniref:hypothetical protein n=1 Tax=Adlercreutzia sp. ZJ304 TaxID=2709791 RepID=UPI0013ED38C8|nr:hypothetical protein [Adlercreutzia sp. ZJ304]